MTEITVPKKRVIRKVKKVEINTQVMCNIDDCKEECNHRIFHDKSKACDVICGVNKKAKCE